MEHGNGMYQDRSRPVPLHFLDTRETRKKLQSLLKNFFKKIKPQEPDLVAPQQEYVDVYSEREFAGYTAFYCYNTFLCKTFQTL